MSDPDAEAEAVERWLEQLEDLDPDDPTVRAYNVEGVAFAANRLYDTVADALACGVPARVIRVVVEHLEDRLSVILRTGETIPAHQLAAELGIDDVDGA